MSDALHPFRAPQAHPGGKRRWLRRTLARLTSVAADGSSPACRILTYHRVNDDHPGDRLSVRTGDFRRQMERLAASGRPVVGLDAAAEALAGRTTLPPGAVVLTFDDGYADNAERAAPILRELRLTATFYLATACIGTGTTLPRYAGCCTRDAGMGWDQVLALAAHGHTIGSHTRTHPELARLALGDAEREIAAGRHDLEQALGRPPRHFCYPRGSESPDVRRLVAAAGFTSATTVRPGANRPGVSLYGLSRTEISGQDSLEDFADKLAGRYDVLHRLVQALRA